MNSISDRISQCIIASGLTKTAFSQKIGLTQAYVSALSIGRKIPSDRTIADICREFNVNETWLRTGEGEMFVKKDPQPLEELLSNLLGAETVTDEDRVLVKNFLELPEASRKAVIEFVQKCAGELSAPVVDTKTATPTPASAIRASRKQMEIAEEHTSLEQEARAEAEKYTEQIYEQILSEKKAAAGVLSGSSAPKAGDGIAKMP